jgi:hypothetical protein
VIVSADLQELFDQAGRNAPPSRIDPDRAVRRARQLRARRRAVIGTTTMAAVLASAPVAISEVSSWRSSDGTESTVAPGSSPGQPTLTAATPHDPSAPSSPPPPSPSSKEATPPADIAAITLANPAPGFRVRRWPDQVELSTLTPGGRMYWTATFGLAIRRPVVTTEAEGSTSATPTGPEVTILVGRFPNPPTVNGSIEGHDVVATPEVAGVTGRVVRLTEKGTKVSTLYFSAGGFSVRVNGFGGVTTAQLVALGNAIDGLD